MGTGKTTTRYSDGTTSVITRDIGGRITEAVGTTGTLKYQYDAGGRLILQDDVSGGERTEYQYDRSGRRTHMRSGNRTVEYRYGKNGELLAVRDMSQRLSVDYR